MCFWREGRIGAESVKFVWANLQVITNGWMVRYLLQEDLRTIFKAGLVCLTQDRVQRLIEEVSFVDVIHRDNDDVLHSLHGVSR